MGSNFLIVLIRNCKKHGGGRVRSSGEQFPYCFYKENRLPLRHSIGILWNLWKFIGIHPLELLEHISTLQVLSATKKIQLGRYAGRVHANKQVLSAPVANDVLTEKSAYICFNMFCICCLCWPPNINLYYF